MWAPFLYNVRKHHFI